MLISKYCLFVDFDAHIDLIFIHNTVTCTNSNTYTLYKENIVVVGIQEKNGLYCIKVYKQTIL
jgi:hypothetical protein